MYYARKALIFLSLTMIMLTWHTQMNAEKLNYPFRFAPQEGLVNATEKPWRSEICLNGYWDFQPIELPESYKSGSGAAPELPMPGSTGWSDVKIKIPSPWNVNGFSYNNFEGPDHRDFPSYPEQWNKVKMGWMKKMVKIPDNWTDKTVILYFEAVAGNTVVYVNGVKVCENFDLFLPFSADVSSLVKAGETAEILVGVRSQELFEDRSTIGRRIVPAGSMWGSYINGIWQDVYLEALPKVYIENVYVKPLVSKGKLEIDVTVRNSGEKSVSTIIKGDVKEWLNLAGKGVNEAPVPNWDLGLKVLEVAAEKISIDANSSKKVSLSVDVPENVLRYWTPESPNLYALLLNLGSKKATTDTKYTRFGWREWTLVSDKQCLNGIPYELHGDSWHFMGIPQMTRRYAWAWFTAIKGMNGNAVRPHAQVYPQFYLDVADELGICVLDETANWGSDGGPKFDSPAFWENSKDHLRRFVLRDRNHASIFGWSVSNENKPVIMNVFNRPDLMPLQEKAWVEWRDIVLENDTTRPWISSDGEDDGNGILPVTVGHYGDEGSMKRWIEIGKPWGIGEHGMAYYGTPSQASKYNGERAYESQQGRMEAIANEAYSLISSQRANGASYSTVFNMAWYALKPLPLGHKDITKVPNLNEDGIFFDNYVEGIPGVQPERLGPYCTTFNPGYDPNLPLYEPWPMYDAMRAVNAPGKPVWSDWEEVNKEQYSDNQEVFEDPYEQVVFVGNPVGNLKGILDMMGVILSDKLSTKGKALYIIDGKFTLDEAKAKEISNSGADVWIWGLERECLESFNPLLAKKLEMDELSRASFIPQHISWVKGMNNSDFYFCELQRTNACRYTLKGEFVDNGKVLLEACKTDWNRWNKRSEATKTASVLRSENECTQALPVFVKCGNVYVSTITDFVNSERGFNTLSKILAHAGIKCTERAVPVDEVFFLRDGSLHFPMATRKHLTAVDEKTCKLEVYVYSPRPLDDLLIEPDMPKLTLSVRGRGASLLVNGKEIKVANANRNESVFNELPLQQGWNKFELTMSNAARRGLDCSLRCENKPDFLQLIKASFDKKE